MKHDQDTMTLIMNSALDSIICMDATGMILRWSDQAEKLFGWKNYEILGKQLAETIIPKRYRDRHAYGLQHYLETGEGKMINELIETTACNREGVEFPVELRVVPIKQNDEEYFCAFLRDITVRKKVEEQLRQSELRYRSLIDQASDAIMITDQTGIVSDVNISLCNLYGYTREDLIGFPGSMVIDPEQLKNDPIDFDRLIKGHSTLRERRMIRKDGTIIEVEANVKMIPDGRILAIARDITDRKAAEKSIRLSEQKYKLLFDKNPIPMMMVTSPELKFMDVNEAATIQYGYSREEFLSLTARDLRQAEDVTLLFIALDNSVEGINNFGMWRHKKKDGSLIQVEIIAQQIIFNDQHVWLTLANDVTEKLQAEEKLKQSHQQLRELSSHLQSVREEERTKIAREIHDELGQQLTGLKMDVSWLNKKIPAGDAALHEKISGMISLIDDTVKTVRRISSELRPGILDDLGLIDALEWQSNEFEKRTGIRSRFSSVFSEIQFDKFLSTGIFRVYQETLTNIARHAHASEIKTLIERSSGNVILSVSDNGAGFDETEIQMKGTLGLMGMRERALMFGGNLTIESIKGKGTLVVLRVPMKISAGKYDT